MPVRVLVADDHPIFREGLLEALDRDPELTVVAECATSDEALEQILALAPEVAVLDHRMPGIATIDLLDRLAAAGSATRVVVLSAFADAETVTAVIEAGAAGYLSKQASRRAIVDGVRRAAGGDTVIASEVQQALAEGLRARRARPRALLSEREQQVLELLAEGLTTPQIAERLVVGRATVKTHLAHLYEKLGAPDRAAAVAEGMRRGLLR